MRPHPTSALASLRAEFAANGWNPDDLTAFRMEDGDGDGSGDGDGDGDGDEGDAGDGDKKPDLKEQGRAAIAKERQKAKEATAALKPWKDLAAAVGMTLEEIQEQLTAKKPEGTKDPDKARRQIEAAADAKATAAANARIVKSEVKALAADLFADPKDAHLYLDLTKYDVDDDGEVDEAAIKADLDELLKSKPHLAKTGRRPKPDPSQGSKGDGKRESQPGLGRVRDAYADSAAKKK